MVSRGLALGANRLSLPVLIFMVHSAHVLAEVDATATGQGQGHDPNGLAVGHGKMKGGGE